MWRIDELGGYHGPDDEFDSDSSSSSGYSNFGSESDDISDLPPIPQIPTESTKQLLRAVQSNNLVGCKRAIEQGADVNFVEHVAEDMYGEGPTFTPLIHYAVKSKNKDIISLLVEKGADLNAQDWPDHLQVLDYIITNELDAIFKLQDPNEFKEREDFLKFLISLGLKPRGNILTRAVFFHKLFGPNGQSHGGNLEICRVLIQNGCPIDCCDEMLGVPLVQAADDPEMVKLFLRYNADVNQCNHHFYKPELGVELNPVGLIIWNFVGIYTGPFWNIDSENYQDKPDEKEVEDALTVLDLLLQANGKVTPVLLKHCAEKLNKEHTKKFPRKNMIKYLEKLPVLVAQPLSLQAHCRTIVRQQVGKEINKKIPELGLPEGLNRYLEYYD